jgi:hypothetical protein
MVVGVSWLCVAEFFVLHKVEAVDEEVLGSCVEGNRGEEYNEDKRTDWTGKAEERKCECGYGCRC